jgi:hypothetical protein
MLTRVSVEIVTREQAEAVAVESSGPALGTCPPAGRRIRIKVTGRRGALLPPPHKDELPAFGTLLALAAMTGYY